MDKCQVIDIPSDLEKKREWIKYRLKIRGSFSGRTGPKTQNISSGGVNGTLQAQSTLGA